MDNAAFPLQKLRQLVAEAARASGMEYPPPEEPLLKFAQFLERYPQVAVVRRRPGQDVLVAPAEHPDLLIEIANPGRIRQDLFDAFNRNQSSISAVL